MESRCAGGTEQGCRGDHGPDHVCQHRDDAIEAEVTDLEATAGLFLLASLLTGYPREGFEHRLAGMLGNDTLARYASAVEGGHWAGLEPALRELAASPVLLDDLRSDYIDLFDRGNTASPIYETSYERTQAFGKTRTLADITGFYHAFGLHLGDGEREMPDHVSVELEFYTVLLVKLSLLEQAGDVGGQEIVGDACRKFLLDHLGRFMTALAGQAGVLEHPLYGRIFGRCRGLVEGERERLGLPGELEALALGEQAEERLECGQVEELAFQRGFPC